MQTILKDYWWALAAAAAALILCCCLGLCCASSLSQRRAYQRDTGLIRHAQDGKNSYDPRYGSPMQVGRETPSGKSEAGSSMAGSGKMAPPRQLQKQPSKLLLGAGGAPTRDYSKSQAMADEMRAQKTFMSAQI